MLRVLTFLTIVFGLPLVAKANEGILIIGATGQLGSYHVKSLAAAGQRVIVLARPTSTFERIEGSEYEVVIGDLLDADALRAAVLEASPAVIIDASNIPGIRLGDGESFFAVAARNLIAAAGATGVTQVILHAAGEGREMLTNPPAAYGSDPQIMNYIRDRVQAEIAWEDSGLTWTFIKHNVLAPEPARATGGARLSADIADLGLVTRADLAAMANSCILVEDCFGKTYFAFDPGMRSE